MREHHRGTIVSGLVEPRSFAKVVLGVGALLRLWQYAAGKSLWLDEIAIALNIIPRPLGQLLTQPLGLEQVAPKGFLAFEKVATLAFGPNDYALRLYALLCGLAALVLFWRLAARVLQGRGALIALGLFAIAPPLIRYSAEAKQYGGDTAATIALMLLAVRLMDEEPSVRRCVLSGLTGAALAVFSQASVIAMAGLGAVLVARWAVRRDPQSAMPALWTVPIWAATSLASLAATGLSMSPSTREFMQWFWRRGFPPVPFHLQATLGWLVARIQLLFSFEQLLHYPLPALYALAMTFGLAALWHRRSPFIALATYAPLLVLIAAALTRQYPLEGRLVLFVVPVLLLGVAATVEALADFAARRGHALGWVLIAAALAPPVYALVRTPPPYDIESHKPVFAYLGAHRLPADPVYVFRSAGLAASYYGPDNHLGPSEYVLGICDRENARAYLEDVDRFRGLSRLWVVTSAVPPLRPPQRNLARYLQTIGTRREGLAVPSIIFGPSTVDLSDLSDPARLRAASAATFPVEPMLPNFPPGCRGPGGDTRQDGAKGRAR